MCVHFLCMYPFNKPFDLLTADDYIHICSCNLQQRQHVAGSTRKSSSKLFYSALLPLCLCLSFYRPSFFWASNVPYISWKADDGAVAHGVMIILVRSKSIEKMFQFLGKLKSKIDSYLNKHWLKKSRKRKRKQLGELCYSMRTKLVVVSLIGVVVGVCKYSYIDNITSS